MTSLATQSGRTLQAEEERHSRGCSRNEVQKAGQRLIRMVPHVTELHHHLLLEPVVDDRHCQWRSLVGQEVSIVSALQVQLQV